jgi:hypothetical protein
MTIQVSITNNDTAGRVIQVIAQDFNKDNRTQHEETLRDINPGFSDSFYCWMTRDLIIREKDPSTYSVPAPK